MTFTGNVDESNVSVKFSFPSRILSSNIKIFNGTIVVLVKNVTLYGPSAKSSPVKTTFYCTVMTFISTHLLLVQLN